MVAITGMPRAHLGWAQFRAFGAAALELCAVADGTIDAFLCGAHASLAPWDYLGGLLIATESGAAVGEYDNESLVTAERVRRRPCFAATSELLTQLIGAQPF